MVHAFVQDVPIDEQTCARITEAFGPEPVEGLLLHLCVRRAEGGLRYIDVWESEEKCARAFAERVHPAVDVVFGGRRPPEPEVRALDVVDVSGSLFPAPPVGVVRA